MYSAIKTVERHCVSVFCFMF